VAEPLADAAPRLSQIFLTGNPRLAKVNTCLTHSRKNDEQSVCSKALKALDVIARANGPGWMENNIPSAESAAYEFLEPD
jgi:hypothetical protein